MLSICQRWQSSNIQQSALPPHNWDARSFIIRLRSVPEFIFFKEINIQQGYHNFIKKVTVNT